jgi:hypothetical protein
VTASYFRRSSQKSARANKADRSGRARRGAVLTTVDIAGDGCVGHLGKMPVNGSLASESSGRRLRSLQFAAERQEWLAAGLAMIAGFLDAYGMITYNTYLSFMSGNTTQTGYRSDKAILEQQCLRRWRSFSSWVQELCSRILRCVGYGVWFSAWSRPRWR